MGKQYILELNVKESTYNLYYARYKEAKKNVGMTHDEFLKQLLR